MGSIRIPVAVRIRTLCPRTLAVCLLLRCACACWWRCARSARLSSARHSGTATIDTHTAQHTRHTLHTLAPLPSACPQLRQHQHPPPPLLLRLHRCRARRRLLGRNREKHCSKRRPSSSTLHELLTRAEQLPDRAQPRDRRRTVLRRRWIQSPRRSASTTHSDSSACTSSD